MLISDYHPQDQLTILRAEYDETPRAVLAYWMEQVLRIEGAIKCTETVLRIVPKSIMRSNMVQFEVVPTDQIDMAVIEDNYLITVHVDGTWERM